MIRTVRAHQGESVLRNTLAALDEGDTLHVYGRFEGKFTSRTDDVRIVGHGAVFDADGEEFAFRVLGDDTEISGATFQNARGAGYFNEGTTGAAVDDCVARNNGTTGFYFLRSSELTLEDSEAFGNKNAGFSIMTPQNFGTEGDVGYDIVVRDNHLHHNGLNSTREKHGGIFDGVKPGHDEKGRWVNEEDGYDGRTFVDGNKFNNNGRDGLLLHFVKNVRLEDNFIFHNFQTRLEEGGGYELGIRGSKNIAVVDNTITADGHGKAADATIFAWEDSTGYFRRNTTWAPGQKDPSGLSIQTPHMPEAPALNDWGVDPGVNSNPLDWG
jgi:nitrous oxidase accessory protein NosD